MSYLNIFAAINEIWHISFNIMKGKIKIAHAKVNKTFLKFHFVCDVTRDMMAENWHYLLLCVDVKFFCII